VDSVQRYFAEQDNRPPPGVKRMKVRQTALRTCGPLMALLESSCGNEVHRIKGSARISLYDARVGWVKPVAVKRFAVDTYREAHDEYTRLCRLMLEESNHV
jgi:hypothetical protein